MKQIAADREATREKGIADLMIPASAYERVFEDEPVRKVVEVLMQSLFPIAPRMAKQGHRSVLVYSRAGAFLGCIRLKDILELLAPPPREGDCAPFEPGMLAERCELLGDITAGEVLGEQRFVDVEAPLMEAVQLMVLDGLINIPVLRKGRLVGVLTDRTVLREICDLATAGIHRSIPLHPCPGEVRCCGARPTPDTASLHL